MFIKYGLQLGPAKPKLTVLMLALHLLDNTKMDKGLFAIPNNKSRWGNLQWGEVWKERNTAETETNINQDWVEMSALNKFKDFLYKLPVTNDSAERNIKLIQDFID